MNVIIQRNLNLKLGDHQILLENMSIVMSHEHHSVSNHLQINRLFNTIPRSHQRSAFLASCVENPLADYRNKVAMMQKVFQCNKRL